eukprot:9481143-Pyramimonas_sp.AAC.3
MILYQYVRSRKSCIEGWQYHDDVQTPSIGEAGKGRERHGAEPVGGGKDDVLHGGAQVFNQGDALFRRCDGAVYEEPTTFHFDDRHTYIDCDVEPKPDALLLLKAPHAVCDDLISIGLTSKDRDHRENRRWEEKVSPALVWHRHSLGDGWHARTLRHRPATLCQLDSSTGFGHPSMSAAQVVCGWHCDRCRGPG